MQTKRGLPKILVILGPNASGKSGLAVNLARKFNGEIVSADSRQVYKGLDLGTGKITKREMRGIFHYLLDVASPRRVFTASDYADLAKQAIKKILDRNKFPILCGGTGFYINSAIYEKLLPEAPPNFALREKLEKKTAAELFAELQKLDPKRAASIDPQNPRRLVRALEIIRATGKNIPPLRKNPKYDVLKIGITWPDKILKKRIRLRLLKRLKAGMVNEVKKLHAKGVSFRRLEDLGLEYRYIAFYLQGKLDKNTMIRELEIASWHYAKRQLTWFRKEKDIVWIKTQKQAEAAIKKFLEN